MLIMWPSYVGNNTQRDVLMYENNGRVGVLHYVSIIYSKVYTGGRLHAINKNFL